MTELYAIKVPEKLDTLLFHRLLEHVAPEKRSRIKRFVREQDRIRGLFGDLLIRTVLMQKTGMLNNEISFVTNEYGKPFLKGRDDIHFNISHSGQWVVAAIDSRPIGVDVEEVAPVDLSISEHYFSPDEHEDLMNQNDKLGYFFTLWTSKESYIKVLGKGLSHPLNAFSIKMLTKDQIIIKADGKVLDDVRIAKYDLHKDYKMAVCATHDNLPRDVKMRSAHGIIKKFVH